MTYKYSQESVSKARSLRRSQTAAEKYLWYKLRNRQLLNSKFYRQYPLGNYIIDFYCPAKKLALELDGSQHLKQKVYDAVRTAYLNVNDITVVRFWDNEIMGNRDRVVEVIRKELLKRS